MGKEAGRRSNFFLFFSAIPLACSEFCAIMTTDFEWRRRFRPLFERLWRNWIAHRSSEPRVGGSNPFRRVFKVFLALVRKAFFLFLRRRGLACGGAVLANAWGAVELSFQTGDAKKKSLRESFLRGLETFC